MKWTVFSLVLAFTSVVSGVTTSTWNNTTGNWSDGTKWDNGVPAGGDFAVIGGGTALLSSSSAALGGLTLSGGFLVFTNWNTCLTAAEVTIGNGATVTLPPAFKNTDMSNNVYFACSNLTIAATGKIDADYKGYLKGLAAVSPYTGHGPGAGEIVCGGSYGGRGGEYDTMIKRAGPVYGSLTAPIHPGSGGSGDSSGDGGNGGGAVRIEATGKVTVNGSILARGEASAPSFGSGSGGAIYIVCRTFGGSGGVITAAGGAAHYSPGGGGRISIVYNTTAQQGEPMPVVSISAARGTGGTFNAAFAWNMGTVYFPDRALFNPDLFLFSGQMLAPGPASWAVDHLTVSNATPRFMDPGFTLTVTNDLVIRDGGRLELGGDQIMTNQHAGSGAFIYSGSTGPVLQVGGKLVLTNSSSLVVYAGVTNGVAPAYGGRVAVTGEVYVGNTCWIYPHSHPTNGGSVRFEMGSLSVPYTNAGFNADNRGFLKGFATGRIKGWGPGGGEQDCGGSYGGKGGSYRPKFTAAPVYGSMSVPTQPGSGGGSETNKPSSDGGGLIWIETPGPVLLNGILSAEAYPGNYSGGSGGGIYLTCQSLAGTGGVIRAAGGRSPNPLCPGGGGRIAVQYNLAAQQALPKPRILFSAAKGLNGDIKYPNDHGTVYLPDTTILDETWLPHSGQFWPMTNWTVSSMTVSNGLLRFAAPGFALKVNGDIVVKGATNTLFALGGNAVTESKHSGAEEFVVTLGRGPRLEVSGNLILTNGARFAVYAGETNSPGSNGALVAVNGDIRINPLSWIHPHSQPTNGGSVWFEAANVLVATNAGFDADFRGYRKGLDNENFGFGPGGARGNDSGGGYGGTGGWFSASSRAGLTYGDSNAPAYPGSAGRGEPDPNYTGGNGGGLIRIKASGTVSVKGKLTARGAVPQSSTYGGGAGGGIYVVCKTFTGDANGSLVASGGNGAGSAGGGGRIAVFRLRDTAGGAVTATAAAGTGSGTGVAYPGTVVWGQLKGAGTVLAVY
jgi:hypothetical protein